MQTKVPCYLRTFRRQWGLTQRELALLVPKGRRTRVSDVERGAARPRTTELFAYSLIFGCPPQAIFPAHAQEIVDEVMSGAAALDRELADDKSLKAARKAELLRRLLRRIA